MASKELLRAGERMPPHQEWTEWRAPRRGHKKLTRSAVRLRPRALRHVAVIIHAKGSLARSGSSSDDFDALAVLAGETEKAVANRTCYGEENEPVHNNIYR